MKTVIRNSYIPKLGDYCETIVVDRENERAFIFDQDGVFTEMPQPIDVEDILRRAAEYTDSVVEPINEKLDTIEEGAQVNKIEHVLKNGTELTITNKTVNVTVPVKTSDLTNDGSDGTDTYVESATLDNYYTKTETDTQIGYETDAREIADAGLQEQIDAIVASSDVVDIVGTYAALQAYDTSKLGDNDIIKVLTDETRDDATTYYRWDADTSTWSYIGAEGPFYTKAESDAIFTPMTRTVNGKALSSDITLTAADVHALPDSTVIPTVNDATLTIQKNGTTVQTFTANQATNATANITVPTDTSDLTNDGDGQSPFATEDYVDTYGGKIDTIEVNGTAQPIVNKTVDITVPTKTSDLTNDGSDGTSTYAETDDLGAAAFSNQYTDLDGLPTIPTVNDATLTIQKNGVDVATFTANSSTNQTANIVVPTLTSDLTNDSGFITTAALANYYTKGETYSQNEINSLISAITVPTKTSDLTNDGSTGASTYVETSALGAVAFSNDYNDLDNKPAAAVDFTGATASTAGAHGLVPAPAAGDQDKYLKADGTWATVQGGGSTVTTFYWNGSAMYKDSGYSTAATISDVETAANAGPVRIRYAGLGRYEYLVTDRITAGEYFSTVWAADNGNLRSVVYTYSSNTWSRTSVNVQPLLTAGTNITINGNTISASIPIDSALDVTSTNPVQNSVVTAALNGKQATLTAGTGISISNNVISATGGGAPMLYIYFDSEDPGKMFLYKDDNYTIAATGGDLISALEAGNNTVGFDDGGGMCYLTVSVGFEGDGDWRLFKFSGLYVDASGYAYVGPDYYTFTNDDFIGVESQNYLTIDESGRTARNLQLLWSTYGGTTSLRTWYNQAEEVSFSTVYNALETGTVHISDHSINPGVDYKLVSNRGNYFTGVLLGANNVALKYAVFEYRSGSTPKWYKTEYSLQNELTAGSNITISNGTISATDTTYSDFTGATSSVAGAHGLVPAPAAGDDGKVLHGDGTWKDATAKLVEMSYGESNAWAKFIAAYNAGSIVYCRASSNANPATGSQTRKAFMAYVNNATNPTNVEFQYVRSQSSKTDSQQCDQVFVYKLTNANGGTWTVESRNMAPKINVSGAITKTFSNGANATVTIGASTMTGATSSTAGATGVVPAPAAGDQDKFLKGDGTWGVGAVTNNISSTDWSTLWQ